MEEFFQILENTWTENPSAPEPASASAADAPSPEASVDPYGSEGKTATREPSDPPDDSQESVAGTVLDSPTTNSSTTAGGGVTQQSPMTTPSPRARLPSPTSSMPPPPVPEKKRLTACASTPDPFAPGLSEEETERRVRARVEALRFFGSQTVFASCFLFCGLPPTLR